MRHGVGVWSAQAGRETKPLNYIHVQRAHFATRSSNLRNVAIACLAPCYTDALPAAVPGHVGLLAGLVKMANDGGDTINEVL
jgi:hypothetical protein